MDIHKNARLTRHGRERLVKMILSGQMPKVASEAAGVCPRTGRKWRDRSATGYRNRVDPRASPGTFLEIGWRLDACSPCNGFRVQLGGLSVQIHAKLLHLRLVSGKRRKASNTAGVISSAPLPAGLRFQLGQMVHFHSLGVNPIPGPQAPFKPAGRTTLNVLADAASPSMREALSSNSSACR